MVKQYLIITVVSILIYWIFLVFGVQLAGVFMLMEKIVRVTVRNFLVINVYVQIVIPNVTGKLREQQRMNQPVRLPTVIGFQS